MYMCVERFTEVITKPLAQHKRGFTCDGCLEEIANLVEELGIRTKKGRNCPGVKTWRIGESTFGCGKYAVGCCRNSLLRSSLVSDDDI